jgi:hypothetical protein
MSDFILLHRARNKQEVVLRKSDIKAVYRSNDGSLICSRDGETHEVEEVPQRVYDLLNMERILVNKDGKIERIK